MAQPAIPRHTLRLLPLLPSGPGGVYRGVLRGRKQGHRWLVYAATQDNQEVSVFAAPKFATLTTQTHEPVSSMSDLIHPEHQSLVKLSTPTGILTLELLHDLPTDQLEQASLDDFTVTRLWLSNLVEHPEQTNAQVPDSLKNVFLNYFDGNLSALSELNFDLVGLSDFQFDVLGWLAQAPVAIISYKQIAQAIGKPKSARAVGSALKSNPIPLIIPCHRVLPVSGKIGGYLGTSKAGGVIKRYLLWHEGLIESAGD